MFNNIKLILFSLQLLICLTTINCTDIVLIDNNNSTVINVNNTENSISNTTESSIEKEGDFPHVKRIEIKCHNISEVVSNCSNSCPASCEDPDREPCRNNYCWRGCECKPGYVKEHQNWTCIPVELCPKCALNEHFRECGPSCQSSCTNYQNTPPYCNTGYHCQRGCFCDNGFVRDFSKNGTCVSVDKCPQKCGENEYLDELGPACRRTSENPRPKCLDQQPEPTCVCNTGFTRNKETGICQTFSNLVIKCGGNETYSQCGDECARKCFDQTPRKFCQTICLRGCFCNEGYVRDPHNERCVLAKDCYVWRPEPID